MQCRGAGVAGASPGEFLQVPTSVWSWNAELLARSSTSVLSAAMPFELCVPDRRVRRKTWLGFEFVPDGSDPALPLPPLSQLLKIAQLARRSCHQREKSLPGDFARVAAAVRGLQVIGLPFHVEAPRRGSCAGGCLPQTSAYQEQCWVGQESNGAGMHGRLS